MTNELIFRALAVVAAALVVAGPYLVAVLGKIRLTGTVSRKEDDAHTVIEIARRLQVAGSKEGVALCQQLLEVLLRPEGAKK
jgi:hypothetical protein